MADRGSYGLGPRLDIQQLFLEAQHRWLRPAEICEILRNYQKFHIATEPPNRPPSGSLFLFDRKVLRYFRKDGHNWRKKKDGKTVKEAHEKLKVGSIDVLHCYYAHGEENENFQRRSYWMLEQELMHIVFVHYLEVKGNRTSSSPTNSLVANYNREPSGNTDSTSPSSTLSSLAEDADSADSHQTNSGYHPVLKSSQMQSNTVMGKVNSGQFTSHFQHPGLNNHEVQPLISGAPPISYSGPSHANESQGLPSWEEVLEQCTSGYNSALSHAETSSSQPGTTLGIGGSMVLGDILAGGSAGKEEFQGSLSFQSNWQIPLQNSSFHLPQIPADPTGFELGYDFGIGLFEQRTDDVILQNALEPFFSSPAQKNDQHVQMHSNPENDVPAEGYNKHTSIVKQQLLDGEEGLKKVDSFSRWVSRELPDVDDLHMRSSSGLSWSTVDCGPVDESSLSPSISQDQLFSIIDFSPKWAYADTEIEVHIIGTFLKSQDEVAVNWSCMFGEVEVPAEVLADGILCCYAPTHSVARVPFYVTCSNRLACSEIREFDFLVGSKDVDIVDVYGGNTDEIHLCMQLERLLSLRSSGPPDQHCNGSREKKNLISKIMFLKEADESYQLADPSSEKGSSQDEVGKQHFQTLMKEKLHSWLIHRVTEGGKGPSVLDDNGQGVIHLAAALGWDWAIKATVTAGININFRDVNGWTALHWAAFYGREQTVAVLLSLGAAPGALTDPSPDIPLGRTPADLASANGHKGISGFLAESSLTKCLESLTVDDQKEGGTPEFSGINAVQTISERSATPVMYGDVPDELSLKDSLTAVRNATQAANRIYQVYRMQSFQRKQLTEYDDDEEFGVSDERALSLVAARAGKPGHSDLVHAAATQIQKKYRGWKKRKEFLIIRQRIVKIQAHVRGHQVRKQYKPIVWSVSILEKIILRWRRKGSGLRGFRREEINKDPTSQSLPPSQDEDCDVLKEGRKQNEERMQKALTRVKSMFHYPEGRAQYRRLLKVVEGIRENKATDMVLSSSNETADVDDDLTDFESLLDYDTLMSVAFE